jgi:hypothetical protein
VEGYHVTVSDAARQIEQLRAHRVRPEVDTSITSIISAAASKAQKTHKQLGCLIDLWEQLLPEKLASQTAITSLRGGTVHVAAADAATHYEIDRLLREGLEQQLRASYRGTLVRVRVKVSPDEVAPTPDIR